MYDSMMVHEVDGGHKLAKDLPRFFLCEHILFTDALQQLSPFQQLQNYVRVSLTKYIARLYTQGGKKHKSLSD